MKEIIKTLRNRFTKKRYNGSDVEKSITASLVRFSQLPVENIYKEFRTSIDGLEEKRAKVRLKKYGYNEIAHEKPPAWYTLLLRNFTNPFVVLTMVLGVISFFLGQYDSVVIIAVMVIISVFMRFFQEYKSNKAAEKLKALVSTMATVFRKENTKSETRKYEIKMTNLVPGDIIHLSAGDMVPADVRLISSKDLYVSQSTLTGESLPVEKEAAFKPKDSDANPLSMPNLCFMGTNVLNGTASAIVLNTSNNTYIGALSKSITGTRAMTSFDIGINKVTWLMIKFICIMVPCVFVLNGVTKGDWVDALLFSLAVAIGLTPEMLPMIVTANLARGAIQMSRSKVVVKQLNAIQNFGAMNILCTDKTGTLTEDHIILEKYLDSEGKDNDEVLYYGFLNSYYQTGLKNLLDIAVLEHKNLETEIKDIKKIDEIPFDFTRRRMSVVIQKDPNKHLLVCKGALEEILAVCNNVDIGGTIQPMTPDLKNKLTQINDNLNEEGMRVLGVSYREFPADNSVYKLSDEQNLVFVGFLAFLDPPKLSAENAISLLSTYGVKVKILTGDNEKVTEKICDWVKLTNEGTFLGKQIDAMNDEELKKAVEQGTVFAKLTPLQKSKIILALKSNGHTVGFLGDGINDAPALREADIGISVDTAVDIAKESADIIMLEKNLEFLAEGVMEGRRTFGNIIKYIKMALSSNFGNVFSVLGASAILPFLPMLSIQILLQNLLYDLSQTTIPFDRVDTEFLLKPRKWDPGGIARFMIFIGPISSIFDFVTFGVMWYVFAANSVETQSLFQSGWFVEGLLSQTLIVHMIRTQKIPFIQSCASLPLLLTTILIMAVGIIIPFTFVGKTIDLIPLPGSYFLWLFGILLSYCVLTQIVKLWFIRRFNYWL